MISPLSVYLLSLGCPKNDVDSQVVARGLLDAGLVLVEEPQAASIIIINTCAFIKEAKEESIAAILEAGKHKQSGSCRYLVVVGCLAQRYEASLPSLLPEVDLFLGVNAIGTLAQKLLSHIEMFTSGSARRAAAVPMGKATFLMDASHKRLLGALGHYAYLKISDGCSNRCSYCAIPEIRGAYRERRFTDIIVEAQELVAAGARELIVSAQETTRFGEGIPGNPDLADLLKALAGLAGVRWIRLLYTHPARLTDRLLETIRDVENICPYIDMPIQHSDDAVLAAMGRKITRQGIITVIEKIRQMLPQAVIRTSLIVGFPLESARRFRNLLAFVEAMRFERLGVFCYSCEEGTPAYALGDPLSQRLKEERRSLVMEVQANISREINERLIGSAAEVLIDSLAGERDGENIYIGRTLHQAPDVDGTTYVRTARKLKSGDFVRCRVLAADTYDLEAVLWEDVLYRDGVCL